MTGQHDRAKDMTGRVLHRARAGPISARAPLPALVACVLVVTLIPGAAARAARRVPPDASGQPALHVIPFPGTPDASPQSQIIFSSLARSDLKLVTVTGSTSGLHAGRLLTLPDRAGVAFIPAHAFTPGERVIVQARLTSTRAGTASGDAGARGLTFSFTVATPAPGQAATVGRDAGPAAASPGPFHSAHELNPPPVARSSAPAPGSQDIFLSPYVGVDSSEQSGLMILNPRGQLVWFRPVRTDTPYNLEVQRYRGRPVLTWWQGVRRDNTSLDGEDVIVDGSYRTVAVLHAAEGYSSDLHDFQITTRGTALLDTYVPVRANLSSLGGQVDARLEDCVIQELDIRTGRLLWEWHAWGHVPLSDSELRPSAAGRYDPFHLNSIQQLPGHRLLVSFRNTWAVYEIDERTGRVIWTLGGKHSNFAMGPGTRFEWQHDAHLYGHGLLTLFDDAASPQEEPQSSAKELDLDLTSHRVTLVEEFTHSPPILASAEGSVQLLGDRDVFVEWGDVTAFSEYTPSGRQIFNATMALGVKTYRAYRFAWTGHPLTPPGVALYRSGRGTTWVYVSWNGATQVARWRVLGGQSPHALKPIKTKHWTGFQTAIGVPSAPHYLAVQGLGANGRVLGRSRTMTAPSA